MSIKGYSVLIVTAVRVNAAGVLRTDWYATAYGLGVDATFNTYRRHVNDLQRAFDADGDPKRAYVCTGGMPTYAGGMPEPVHQHQSAYPAKRQHGARRQW